MANPFVNFLGGAINGSGNLRDYQHAARLYVDNFYALAPKAGWMYFVILYVNPEVANSIKDSTQKAEFQSWLTKHRTVVGLLAKSVDLPRFSMKTETLNQYNKKTVVQTQINYAPVSVSFHDDMSNATHDLWKHYYRHYFADSLDSGSLSSPASIVPKYTDTKFKDTSNQNYNYGLNNGQTVPFFTAIEVYQLYQKKFTSFKLVNPVIKEWAHDSVDQSAGNKMLASKMTVDYETVIYGKSTTVNERPIGFAETHYDRTPSPLSIGGQGTVSILGEGGLLAGATDVFGSIENMDMSNPLDIMNVAIKGANLAKNAKKISKEGIKEEGYSILNSVIAGAATTDAAVIDANGNITKTPATTRAVQGASQTISGIAQVVNPAGVNFFTGNNSSTSNQTIATQRKT